MPVPKNRRNDGRQHRSQQAEAAAVDREWLKLFVDYAQGDPRLTAWEEAFVASMRHYAYRTGHYADLDPGWRLSHKQLELCHRIDDKLQIAEQKATPTLNEADDP